MKIVFEVDLTLASEGPRCDLEVTREDGTMGQAEGLTTGEVSVAVQQALREGVRRLERDRR